MPFSFTMPKLSPTMEEGVIAKWHKQKGDYVESGDLLLEVTTDKATLEHQAIDPGYLREILVQDGESAQVNQAIAVFSEEQEEAIEEYVASLQKATEQAPVDQKPEEETDSTTPKEPTPQASTIARAEPTFQAYPPLEGYQEAYQSTVSSPVKASPLAKKKAEEMNLDLTSITGTGPAGRIVERDLSKAQPKSLVSPLSKQLPSDPPGSFELEPLSPMRKAIAKRLKEAKSYIPHFYVSHEIDASMLVALRAQLKKNYGIAVTYNDFVMRAVALALKSLPKINVGFDSVEEACIQFKTVDVAVAVSVEGGLITPIIRYADTKSLSQLHMEVRNLASQAKKGTLQPEQYQGGSFTVSNLGMYGITHFQAILNPPQAAILAVGGIQSVPVVKDGECVPGKKLAVTLSCDHRVIDGADAAEFLALLKKFLEEPAGLLV